MARKVKCCITHTVGSSDEYIKIGNKYYASQEVYDNAKQHAQLRKEIIRYICEELLHYTKGQVFPTVLTKKLQELQFYDQEVILETLHNKTKDILYQIDKENKFSNDYGKVCYLFAVVSNSINDVYRDSKIQKQKTDANIQTDINIDDIKAHNQNKNISNWLEADEL